MKIVLVYCDQDTFKKEYFDINKCKAIDYKNIISNLKNSDPTQKNINTELINITIIKKLNRYIQNKNTEIIYYRIDQLNDEFIKGLKNCISEYCYSNPTFELFYHYNKNQEIPINTLKNNFDNIKFI